MATVTAPPPGTHTPTPTRQPQHAPATTSQPQPQPQHACTAAPQCGGQPLLPPAQARFLRTWFPVLLLFRVANSLCVRTYFTPDEYWQGPEVAHGMVFGYGHR